MESFKDKMTLAGQNSNRFNSLVVQFAPLGTGVLGTCNRVTDSITNATTYIVSISNLWNILTKAEREQLIYHELGHCILDRGHLATYTNGRPDSIMNIYSFSGAWYTDSYVNYLSELFSVPLVTFSGLHFIDSTYALTIDDEDSQTQFSCSYSHDL